MKSNWALIFLAVIAGLWLARSFSRRSTSPTPNATTETQALKADAKNIERPTAKNEITESHFTPPLPQRPRSFPTATPWPAATLARREDEDPPRPRHPGDSVKKIGELRAMYAVKDLRDTLKAARAFPRLKELHGFITLTDDETYQLLDGKFARIRVSIGLGQDGLLTPDSCASIRFADRKPTLGFLSQGTLTVQSLPEPHCFLIGIHNTYFILKLMEFAKWRHDIPQKQPALELLYQKQTNASIGFRGQQVRINGAYIGLSNIPNDLTRQEWCGLIPEPIDQL